jgi:hypothetical protein
MGRIEELARQTPGLDLLLLFGSRAREDAHPGSDWDLGYLARPEFDPDDFLARLVLLLETDRIDLVNLARTSGLLRYRAAAEGRPLFAFRSGSFEDFWFEAVSFWCDMGPIFRDAYDAVLEELTQK